MRKGPFCTFLFLAILSTLSIPIRKQRQWGLMHICLDWPLSGQMWSRFRSLMLRQRCRGRKQQRNDERLAREFQCEDKKCPRWCKTEAWTSDMSTKEHWRTEELNNERNLQQWKPPISSFLLLTTATLLYVSVNIFSCESFIEKPLPLIAEFVAEWTFENASI